ncbi:hypothetical protein L596_026250 [Steinernema carpocapsae]|uniref:Thioredoxin domain-containing protein n=1 Tax=Steinernema carpocapsae TaxID=34508 RepID=A0A4U5M1T2_STECR|nr:hypothetical protein L596_026250 [Steinernema carpocapsae]
MSKLLENVDLGKKDGSFTKADVALNGKIVAFYFSASWCPPCRLFTPILKDFYEEVGNDDFEVVFVSSDRSNENLLEYMRKSHGDWFFVDVDNLKNEFLRKKYHVNSIPKLVIAKADGTVITEEGRGEIMASKTAPAALLRKWKQAGH